LKSEGSGPRATLKRVFGRRMISELGEMVKNRGKNVKIGGIETGPWENRDTALFTSFGYRTELKRVTKKS